MRYDMESKYKPTSCRASADMGTIYVCRLATKPCCVVWGEKCYMQRLDEMAVPLMGLKPIRNGEVDDES